MEIKKNCHHCLHIRPKKNNRCTIKNVEIKDIYTFCCKDFLLDVFVEEDHNHENDKPIL